MDEFLVFNYHGRNAERADQILCYFWRKHSSFPNCSTAFYYPKNGVMKCKEMNPRKDIKDIPENTTILILGHNTGFTVQGFLDFEIAQHVVDVLKSRNNNKIPDNIKIKLATCEGASPFSLKSRLEPLKLKKKLNRLRKEAESLQSNLELNPYHPPQKNNHIELKQENLNFSDNIPSFNFNKRHLNLIQLNIPSFQSSLTSEITDFELVNYSGQEITQNDGQQILSYAAHHK